jgi:hypothetical protein
MENLKAQKKIIDLGKAIVKELELDPGVDTLAKWMAHYVAEKIESAEKLNGKKKMHAEKECFETILKLWEHRWSIPRGKPFMKDFEPLFETLEKLNPTKENPFFYSPLIELELEKENNKKVTDEAESYFQAALRVDKLARSLIYDFINQAVSGIQLSEKRSGIIRNAIHLINHLDMRIIKFTSEYNKSMESQENNEYDEKKKRIEDIQKKIKDLEEFTSLKGSLLDRYKKELSEIEN